MVLEVIKSHVKNRGVGYASFKGSRPHTVGSIFIGNSMPDLLAPAFSLAPRLDFACLTKTEVRRDMACNLRTASS